MLVPGVAGAPDVCTASQREEAQQLPQGVRLSHLETPAGLLQGGQAYSIPLSFSEDTRLQFLVFNSFRPHSVSPRAGQVLVPNCRVNPTTLLFSGDLHLGIGQLFLFKSSNLKGSDWLYSLLQTGDTKLLPKENYRVETARGNMQTSRRGCVPAKQRSSQMQAASRFDLWTVDCKPQF